jgi:hypothetical protein
MSGPANPHAARVTIIAAIFITTVVVRASTGPHGIHWLTIFENTLIGLGALATLALLVYAILDHRSKHSRRSTSPAGAPRPGPKATPQS